MSLQKRCQTGLEGLDDITGGGLPENRLYLIQGQPGVGKTTLALQFLQEGARRGERGLYITLSETKEELEGIAISHGWNLDNISFFELSAVEKRLADSTSNTFFHPSEIELDLTTKALMEEVGKTGPSRLVFDSLSEMRMLAETPLPKKGGLEVLEYARQQPQLRKAVVNILSSSTRPADIEKAAFLGANAYFIKPSRIEKFQELIENWYTLARFEAFPVKS